jgi:hypothetical protein
MNGDGVGGFSGNGEAAENAAVFISAATTFIDFCLFATSLYQRKGRQDHISQCKLGKLYYATMLTCELVRAALTKVCDVWLSRAKLQHRSVYFMKRWKNSR